MTLLVVPRPVSMWNGVRVPTARSGQTATLLADGTILVMGGRTVLGRLAETAELFDAQSGVPVRAVPPSNAIGMTTSTRPSGSSVAVWPAGTGHAATLTSNGRVVVSGGADENGRLNGATALIDPTSGRTVALAAPVDNGEPAHLTAMSMWFVRSLRTTPIQT